jgi:CubicO group peptidase (beta-lactamase class C family)
MKKNGTIIYKNYISSPNSPLKLSDDTPIHIASGSKWLASAVVMTLVDSGALKLDDKVSKFYPNEFAASDRKDMTV